MVLSASLFGCRDVLLFGVFGSGEFLLDSLHQLRVLQKFLHLRVQPINAVLVLLQALLGGSFGSRNGQQI